MSDYLSANHIPVWGIAHETGDLVVLGTITVDRTQREPTYTAQHDEYETCQTSQAAAADWLYTMDGRPFRYVVVGRVFRPEMVATSPVPAPTSGDLVSAAAP